MARLEGIQLQAKTKAYQNYIDALKAGKKLSKSDLSTMDALWEEIQEAKAQESAPAPSGPEAYTISAPDLAGVLRVTSMTLSNWRKAGMPRLSHGLYPLLACISWWQDNIVTRTTSESTTELQNEHLREKIRKARVEANQAEAKVCAWTDIEDQWCQRVGEMRQALLTMSVRLPPLLEGKPLHDLRDILHAESCAFLSAYARGGTYTPALTESQIQEVVTKCLPKQRSQKRQPARSKRSRSKR